MILKCPACATRFLVADDQIGATGRTVRCGKCAHQWHCDPPPSEPGPEPVSSDDAWADVARTAQALSEPATTQAEDTEPADDLPEIGMETDVGQDTDEASPDLMEALADASEPAPEETTVLDDAPSADSAAEDEADDHDTPSPKPQATLAPEPDLRARPLRSNLPAVPEGSGTLRKVGWAALVLFWAGIGVLLFGFGDTVRQAWPPSTSIYVALGMIDGPTPAATPAVEDELPPTGERITLQVSDPEVITVGGRQELVLSGALTNRLDRPVDLPPLRAQIRNEADEVILEWRFQATPVRLAARQATTYRTQRPFPPDAARAEVLLDWEELAP